MANIKIAVAGCLGRMGQELSKQIINNNKLEFVGGFEHKKHKDIKKQFKNVSDINSTKIIDSNPTISITTAILGGDVEVPTIEGKKARLNIPPGTQSETQFRLKGKGMSSLRQTRRGDMYVEANVEIPVNLNSKQKAILQEFEKEGGTSKKHSPKSQSFFSKLKEVWEDLT